MGSLRSAAHPVPVDLLAAVGLTIASNAAVFVPGLRDTPLRVLLGFVFVSLVPGYVVVAALFPEGLHAADGDSEGGPRPPDQRGTAGAGGVTVTERLLLSVGVSLVVVPAIGYAWNFTPGGVRLVPVLLSVSGFSVAVAGLAALRRRRLPADAQFRPRLPGRFGGARSDDSGVPRLVNAVLVLSVLCFAASAGYAAVELSHDERYSELSLVSPDGERFAGTGGSPVVTAGDRQTVGVAVGNHEGRATNYTVVVVQQTVDDAGNGTVVGSQIRLDQFTVAVADNETVVRNHTVAPPARGNRSRVVWLLYAGETPDSPSVDSAANHVYLWVTSNETDVESRAPR
jgi:uncharacterized membrane protein